MLEQGQSEHQATAPRDGPGDEEAPSAAIDPVELALWMGQMLMDNGAESERVEHAVRTCAAGLGAPLDNITVTHDTLLVTKRAEEGSHTWVQKVRPKAVNMALIAAISKLSHRLARRELSPQEVAAALARIHEAPRHYSPTLTALATGLACAAFSRLFHGDEQALAITFVAATGAMWIRHHYAKLTPNRLVFAGVSACAAGGIAGLLQRHVVHSDTQGAAFVACVLMLIPGVPAINAVQDVIKGRLEVGLARAVEAMLIVLAATLGLLLGLGLSWVQP